VPLRVPSHSAPAADPANTGNIIRLCANYRLRLHLIDRWDSSLDRRSCGGRDSTTRVAIVQRPHDLKACSRAWASYAYSPSRPGAGRP